MLVLFLAAAVAASGTSLKIISWPQGQTGPRYERTLRCDPAGGTLPRAAEACKRLASTARPFAPVPDESVCTQIYGGPQQAIVAGTYRGRRIWVRFDRSDGCQIRRWRAHEFLFRR